MSASTSSSASRMSEAQRRWIGAGLAAVVFLVFLGLLWGILFSLFLDGFESGGRFLSPFALWSAYATGSASQRYQVLFCGGVSALVIVGIVVASFVRRRKLHGDARFGNEVDVRKADLRQPWGSVLGLYRGRLMAAPPPGNVACYGPPGGGKGVGWIIPTLLSWQGSVVTLDPKKENWSLTAGFRARHSRAGDVILFDPLNYDGRGWRYNPLGQLGTGTRRIDDVIKIANMLLPLPLTGEPMWTSAARDLFVGGVLAFAELNDRYKVASAGLDAAALARLESPPPVSIGSIFNLVVAEGNCGERCAALASRLDGGLGKRLLGAFAALPHKQAEGVLSTLKDKIGIWANPAIAAATEVSDFDFKDLRRRRRSIYLGVSPENIDRLSSLLGLMFQQAIDSIVSQLPAPDEKHYVLFCIDEAAMLKRMPVLAASLAFLRGYLGVVMMVFQSPAQGEEHYGQFGWRAMVDCFKYRVFYAPNSLETATAISRELGQYTMKAVNYSTGSSGNASRSYSDARRELLLPQEVLQIGRDKLVLFVEGLRPIEGRKFKFYEHPTMLARSKIPAPVLPTYQIETVVGGYDRACAIVEAESEHVEDVANEGVLEIALAALVSADSRGDVDQVEQLQEVAKDVARRLPPGKPADPALQTILECIGFGRR